MKFEPELPSYILALNQDTREEDLAMIADFYEGEIIELKGCWQNKEERSYQIFQDAILDYSHMLSVLKFCDQGAFIMNNAQSLKGTWLYSFLHMPRDQHPIYLGVMTQVPTKEESCTHCPSTNTYWKTL